MATLPLLNVSVVKLHKVLLTFLWISSTVCFIGKAAMNGLFIYFYFVPRRQSLVHEKKCYYVICTRILLLLYHNYHTCFLTDLPIIMSYTYHLVHHTSLPPSFPSSKHKVPAAWLTKKVKKEWTLSVARNNTRLDKHETRRGLFVMKRLHLVQSRR